MSSAIDGDQTSDRIEFFLRRLGNLIRDPF